MMRLGSNQRFCSTTMANKCCSGQELLLAILAFIFSPLAVLIHAGVGERFFINLLLFILGVLPGLSAHLVSLAGDSSSCNRRHASISSASRALNVSEFSPLSTLGILHAWYVILGWRAFRRCVLTIVAFILPPLAVGIKAGCVQHFWINILLTILGFLPGPLKSALHIFSLPQLMPSCAL